MNKNSSTIAIVAVIVIAIIFFAFRGGNTTTQEVARLMEMPAKDVLASASVHIPETYTTVSLKGGQGSFSVVPGGAEGSVSLEEFYAEQTFIKGTSTYGTNARDLFAIIDVASGGSGTFKYLAYFRLSGATLEHKASFLLGDRVKVTAVTAGSVEPADGVYTLSVTYLDRRSGEAMAVAPSVAKTMSFTLQGGTIAKNENTGSAVSPTPVVAASSRTVTYTDSGFSPAVVTIHKGDKVIFVNHSGRTMWVASDPHSRHSNYPEFDDRDGKPVGSSWTFTFTRTGTFGYHSELALFHTGTIIVLP